MNAVDPLLTTITNESAEFFLELYGEESPGYLVVSAIDKRKKSSNLSSYSFPADPTGQQAAANTVSELAKSRHLQIYYSVGLQSQQPGQGQRGNEKDVSGIPGFWMDIDIKGPGHKETNLPTEEEALNFIHSLPIEPTLIIHTGGGLQPYWLLKEPWAFESPEEQSLAASMSRRFYQTVCSHPANKGWKLDNTNSMEHLLRIPGTFNQKLDTPRPVKIIEQSGTKYNLEDIEQILIDDDHQLPATDDGFPPWDGEVPGHNFMSSANIEQVTNNCSAMRRLASNPEDHTEPEWKLFVDIFSHCEGGPDYVREMSKKYPGSNDKEIDKKITNALKIKPRTCKNIKSFMPEYCEGCRQKVKSPIVLGLPSQPERKPSLEAYPYAVIENRLHVYKDTREGPIWEPVANCYALIESEVTFDDGAEQTRHFEIKGKLQTGENLPLIRVAANQFQGLGWVPANWGAGPVIYAGQQKKDHFRCASQMLNPYPNRKEIIGHTGFRKRYGNWGFCHNGGAIGANGPVNNITVELEGPLSGYNLPSPPDKDQLPALARKVISRLLHLTDPDHLAATLLCCIARAPLAEARPIDFSVAITGGSGVQKTSSASIAQGFFGADFNQRMLPGNWASTVNALEKAASQAKDVIFMVDDFAPAGSATDVQRLHRDADRLLRGVGNQSGRLRMRADASLRPEYHARGLVIITGEDLPRGHSLRARLWTVSVNQGDVNLEILTQLQEMAASGELAQVMAAYVQWLATYMDNIKESAAANLTQYRNYFRNNLQCSYHDRVPDIISNLVWGGKIFLQFLQQAGVITEDEMNSTYDNITAALNALVEQQSQYLLDENPAARFIALIRAAFLSGGVHVIDTIGGRPHKDLDLWGWVIDDYLNAVPRGERIGWISEEGLFLEPEAAYKAAQKMALSQGSNLPLTQTALWKRLKDSGILMSYEKKRCLAQKYINGVRQRVLHIHPGALFEVNGRGP